MPLPILIGVHGHAGSGKDTVATYLKNHFSGTYSHSFADPLKEACAELFGIPSHHFYHTELKELTNLFWGASPRQIAQFVGTELVREQMWKLLKADSEDFWVRRMEVELQLRGYEIDDIVVIPDVRFQNEYDWIIQNKGHVIHLTRPGADGNIGIPGHKSEAGITITTPERTHHVNNDSTIEDLHAKVDTIFRNICSQFFSI